MTQYQSNQHKQRNPVGKRVWAVAGSPRRFGGVTEGALLGYAGLGWALLCMLS